MTAYPSDSVLLARGKLSTLIRERKEQVKRLAKIAETMQAHIYTITADCQTEAPSKRQLFDEISRCSQNMQATWDSIHELCAEIAALKPEAWPE